MPEKEGNWYSISAWLLPHTPGKSGGRRWPSVALCGQPGQWQEWVGAPSFLGEEEEGGRRREEWDLAVPKSDMQINLHKHWLDHRVSEAASGTMRWLCNGEESALCSTMHEERGRRERRERTSWNRLVTFGDIWWYRHAKWGGQRWGWHGDAHEWLGEHAPGGKQEADIALTPQRSIGGRGGIRASLYESVTLSLPREEKKLTGHQPKLISLKFFFPTIDYLSAQLGAFGLD